MIFELHEERGKINLELTEGEECDLTDKCALYLPIDSQGTYPKPRTVYFLLRAPREVQFGEKRMYD